MDQTIKGWMVDGVVGSNIEFLQFSEAANGFFIGRCSTKKNKRVIQQKKYIINTKKNLLIRSFLIGGFSIFVSEILKVATNENLKNLTRVF